MRSYSNSFIVEVVFKKKKKFKIKNKRIEINKNKKHEIGSKETANLKKKKKGLRFDKG